MSKKIFKIASYTMIATGLIHLMGHFAPPDLNTDEKQELMNLMTNVQFQFDPWFTRSFLDIFNAFSLFLTVMLLSLGMINLIIVSSETGPKTVRKLSLANGIGMAAMLALSLAYAFSVPITLFLIVTVLYIVSFAKA